jgi:hypothetical protein
MSINEPHLEKLNDLLSNEMSAFKTYEQAKELVQDDVVREQIEDCELSHKQRAQQLKNCIEDLGAAPLEAVSIWNGLAVPPDGDEGISDKETVTALEAGEDSNLQIYQEALETVDEATREILLQQLLPAQEYTHDALSILKISLQ